jgi:hypothetical protein
MKIDNKNFIITTWQQRNEKLTKMKKKNRKTINKEKKIGKRMVGVVFTRFSSRSFSFWKRLGFFNFEFWLGLWSFSSFILRSACHYGANGWNLEWTQCSLFKSTYVTYQENTNLRGTVLAIKRIDIKTSRNLWKREELKDLIDILSNFQIGRWNRSSDIQNKNFSILWVYISWLLKIWVTFKTKTYYILHVYFSADIIFIAQKDSYSETI